MIIEHDPMTKVQRLLQFTRGETSEQQSRAAGFVTGVPGSPRFHGSPLRAVERSRMIEKRTRRAGFAGGAAASLTNEHSMTQRSRRRDDIGLGHGRSDRRRPRSP